VNKSESITKLAGLLAKAQAEMPVVKFDATNPFFKSRYATLGALIDASQPILARNGLAIIQLPINDGAMVGVETIVTHESGEWLSERYCIATGDERGKSPAQAAGSVLTYLSRYSLRGVLKAYADEDTDGNAHPSNLTPANAFSPPVSHNDAPKQSKPLESLPVKPKAAPASVTPAIRDRFLEIMAQHGEWAKRYFWSAGTLLPNVEGIEDFPNDKIPLSKKALDTVTANIEAYYQANKGKTP